MNKLIDYGADIKSDWSFHDGDLQLVTDKENIGQAVGNRLNTMQDELDAYYYDYGSFLQSFLGWRRTDKTLDFIKVEIDSVLGKDPRIVSFTSNLEYDSNGNVRIDLSIDDVSLGFMLTNDGVIEV